MGHLVGIDLGTTNSVVASAEGASPQVLVDKNNRSQFRSVVSLKNSTEVRRQNRAYRRDSNRRYLHLWHRLASQSVSRGSVAQSVRAPS